MFSFLSKKKLVLEAPVSGEIVPLSEVDDPVFASESMGKGVAIDFNGDAVYSPYDGEVVALFPTGHAIGIESKGIQYIIHIGIDTVELNGEGFLAHVKQGDKISKGDLLISVESNALVDKGYNPVTMIVFPEGHDFKLLKSEGIIKQGEDFIQC